MGDVEKHIAGRLLPALRAAIGQKLGEPQHDEWLLLIDEADAQTLNFRYPVALATGEYQGIAYITPLVRLELGTRGDPWPAEKKILHPYAAARLRIFPISSKTRIRPSRSCLHGGPSGKKPPHCTRGPSSVGDPAIFLTPLLRPRHDARLRRG
nr:nucleotidyl transferase AbiEii/AbiGii toxin family protein [Mesorhizobium sp.]